MHNDKTRISASEVNKFTYCPYQWYYTRKYGQRNLNQQYKDMGIRYSHKSPAENNFIRGNKFHKQYHENYEKSLKTQPIQIAIIIFLVLIFLGWGLSL